MLVIMVWRDGWGILEGLDVVERRRESRVKNKMHAAIRRSGQYFSAPFNGLEGSVIVTGFFCFVVVEYFKYSVSKDFVLNVLVEVFVLVEDIILHLVRKSNHVYVHNDQHQYQNEQIY